MGRRTKPSGRLPIHLEEDICGVVLLAQILLQWVLTYLLTVCELSWWKFRGIGDKTIVHEDIFYPVLFVDVAWENYIICTNKKRLEHSEGWFTCDRPEKRK